MINCNIDSSNLVGLKTNSRLILIINGINNRPSITRSNER